MRTKRIILFVTILCLVLAFGMCALTPPEGACTSDADCGEDECCVAEDKRRFLFSHATSGYCHSVRHQGFVCHVYVTVDPETSLHINYCPCADGLECRGTTVDASNSSNVIHHDPKCLPIAESPES